MTQQLIESDQVEGLRNEDIAADAGIAESKVAMAPSGGHDHDQVGTPTPAVLIVRQLKVTASSPPDLLVHVAAFDGVGFPDIKTTGQAAQTVDLSSPLPIGSDKRIDLLYVGRDGVLQRTLGIPDPGSPQPPTHEGLYPVAEIGPLESSTTAITQGMIRDVRPFSAASPFVRVFRSSTDLGLARTIVAGTNMSATLTDGVATLTATGGTTVPDASTTTKGIVRVTVDPAPGDDPIALSSDDPVLAAIPTAIQRSGTVAFTADQSMGGHSLTDLGTLQFRANADVRAIAGGDAILRTSGVGKTRLISEAALQLTSLTDPTNPGVADLWFDPDHDAVMIRTAAGVRTIAVVQEGTIGLGVPDVLGDPTYPPVSSAVGRIACLNFTHDIAADHAITFAIQLPEDALLTESVYLRLAYCMAADGSGTVAIGYEYEVVPVGGDLTPSSETGAGTRILTPSSTKETLELDQGISIPASQLTSRASIAFRLRRRSTDGADTRTDAWQLLYLCVLYGKKDVASARNVVDIIDEVTPLGQAYTLQFRGNMITASLVDGTAVIDIDDLAAHAATPSRAGIARISHAAVDPLNPIAVSVTAPYLPSTGQKAALAGTAGDPGDENRYVTDGDHRMPTDAIADALAGTEGAPSAINPYVTTEDHRLPTLTQKAALVGIGETAPSDTNPYVLKDYANLPTAGQKAALAGTSGTPGNSNRYVTALDTAFVKTDGSRSFTAPVSGVTPTAGSHLATLAYAFGLTASHPGVQNLSQLAAVPSPQRFDKQMRLVEDLRTIYYFDIEGTGGGVPPDEGLGQWFPLQAASNSISVKRDGTVVVANLAILDFQGFTVTESPAGEANVSVPAASDLVDGLMSSANFLKLATIDAGAEVNNISDTNAALLTGGGNTTLHYHPADRARAVHTGTQTRSTISDFAHKETHEKDGGDEVSIQDLAGRAAGSQYISIYSDDTDKGLAYRLKVVGNGVVSVDTSSGVATLTGHALSVSAATMTTLGVVKVSAAPTDPANPIAVETTDLRVPLINRARALVGSYGTPDTGNPYVTSSDPRMHAQNTDTYTNSNSFWVGPYTFATKSLRFRYRGGIRHNFTTEKLEFSHDGSAWQEVGSAGAPPSSGYLDYLVPEYSGATVYFDGTNNDAGSLGLTSGFDATNFHNYYSWRSDATGVNDVCVVVRWRIPAGFTSWNSIKLWNRVIQDLGAAAAVELRMWGTDNVEVALTGGSALQNLTWTQTTITVGSGAFVEGSFITLRFTLYSGRYDEAQIGEVTLDFAHA